MTADDAEAQLAGELGARLYAISILGGVDDQDPWQEGQRLARYVMPPLTSADDNERAQAVIDVGCALWPDTCAPPDEWWRTPLGRLCAMSLARDDSEAVTVSGAAAMLGVHRRRAYQLVDTGKLERHPDGGVTRASVMARLADGP